MSNIQIHLITIQYLLLIFSYRGYSGTIQCNKKQKQLKENWLDVNPVGSNIFSFFFSMLKKSYISYLPKGVTSLPDYVEFKKFPGIPLKDIFSAAGDDLLDMLDRLLDCNPAGRVNATQVNFPKML